MKKLLAFFTIAFAALLFSACGQKVIPLVSVVWISGKNYAIGKTEVTQAQHEAVMGKNPSYFKGADLPVENVSWNDAVEFCKKLTERERESGAISVNQGYRLPTDEEWEYACRAGTTTAYHHAGDTEADLEKAAWYRRNCDNRTHPVGQKVPNEFGLYDMHGNVWERMSSGDSSRVLRGGSWLSSAQFCRSAFRTIFRLCFVQL